MKQFEFGDKATLSRLLGVAPQTISKWLRNRNMPMRAALIAQEEFGVDALALMTESDAGLIKRLFKEQL